MDIKPHLKALQDIVEAVDLSDRIGSLQLYAAANVIYRDLHAELDAIPEEDRPQTQRYTVEKLSYFLEFFSNAVMPIEGDHKTPQERLDSACDNILKTFLNL